MRLKSLPHSPQNQLKLLNWNWMLGEDTLPYITNEVVMVKEFEAEKYFEAIGELYEMFVTAGQYIIDNNLMSDLGIPTELHDLIMLTWEDDRNLHLYGRFDLSGGIDGEPIKLIEFNSDTATCIPESSVVQWAHLKANGLEEKSQFNTLYESLVENFRRLKTLNSDMPATLLLSAMSSFPEDESNILVLGEAASEAGFKVAYKFIEEVEFTPEEGVFIEEEEGSFAHFGFWFKLVPWELIAKEEPQLLHILSSIIKDRRTIVINPPYNLLFQSKGILKILWKLFPNHRYLLQTESKPLSGKKYVEKVIFGREGANVRIIDKNGNVVKSQEGEYEDQPKVYQEYVDFVKDDKGLHYQAGIFFAYEPCALGFRRGGAIIDNRAQFLGHLIG